jgi:hypothetical protein
MTPYFSAKSTLFALGAWLVLMASSAIARQVAPDDPGPSVNDEPIADITTTVREAFIEPGPGSFGLPLVAQLETVARLAPDQLQWSISVADPTATKLLIRLMSLEPGVEWSLDREENLPVTAANVEALGGGVLTAAPNEVGPDGFIGIGPAPGVWNTIIVCPSEGITTLRLSGVAAAPVVEFPVNVHITFVGSPVKVALVPSRANAKVGSRVGVSAAVFEDITPIPGAQIRATAIGPAGQVIGIDLLDNGDANNAVDLQAGDGLYSASFTPDQDGDWTIGAIARVPVEDISLVRTSVTRVDVYPNDVALVRSELVAANCVMDPVSEILDQVEAVVQVNAARACEAMMVARFKFAPDGKPFDVRSFVPLDPGLNTVRFSVPAATVKKFGHEGQILVTEFSAHTGEAGEFLADSWRPSSASACQVTILNFPGQDVEVLPGCTSRTEDRNANGKPDHLVIDVPLAVRVAGLYTCQSELRTDDEWSAGNMYSTFDLPRSPRHVVSFAFPAGVFSRKGRDGPFRLDGMIFWRSDGGTSMTHNVICWIDAVDTSEFDEYVPCADRNRNGVCDEREPSSGDQNSDGIPDDTPNARPCLRIADLVGDQPGSGPDGCVNEADMNAFIDAYYSGSLLADVSSQDGEPDGLLTQIDLDTFLIAYQECAGNCDGGSVP